MQHSEDALAGTDQKGSTFWKKVATSYNKLVAKTNSINEALISYKQMEELRQLELANRKKAALYNSAIDVNESAEEHAKKCCYPDCPELDQDNVNECGGKECKHGLLFHHSCQVAYEAAHGKESTVKRCYECAQFFVMGIEEY